MERRWTISTKHLTIGILRPGYLILLAWLFFEHVHVSLWAQASCYTILGICWLSVLHDSFTANRAKLIFQPDGSVKWEKDK